VKALRNHKQFLAESLTRAAVGLDRVAVRAEGDHLSRVVLAAQGEVLDVVDFEEWLAGVGHVFYVAGTVRVLASARAGQDDRSSCGTGADWVG
jgi:hypothetical protein